MNDESSRAPDPLEIGAAHAALPFALLEELRVPCGYERSFKMLDGRLLANRFLLGVNAGELPATNLLAICRRLNMPEEYVELLTRSYADCNLVFLGFEDHEPGYSYRVYLEFWDKLIAELPAKANPREPALLHLGFKWDPDDNSQRNVSRYTCYPLLSVAEILARLSDIYAGRDASPSLATAIEVINYAASCTTDHAFVYVEVEEDGNPRRSFDLNLYKAAVRLHQIWPALERLRVAYAIPAERFERLLAIVGEKLCGHLSGGLNRQHEDFLTVYFEQ